MSTSAKLVLYRVARASGLFGLARFLTRRRVRILGYHGFALHDEAHFRTKLFITPKTFESRLALLQRRGYKVVSLAQAVAALQSDRMTDDMVVITIDDGYASTLSVAAPLLSRYGFPATVYLTTYHMQTQTPVFDLLVAYLIWKATVLSAPLDWPNNGAPLTMDLGSAAAKNRTAGALMAIGHAMSAETERVELSRAIARALAIDHEAVVRSQSFRLLTPSEARQLPGLGVEIGLHTHRHRFPASDLATCQRELDDNRAYLMRELGVVPKHFCYPSGVYDPCQWPLLSADGLESGTTCDTGLVRRGDPRFGLKRVLDGELVSEVEFDAELSGFAELLRQLLRVDRRVSAV